MNYRTCIEELESCSQCTEFTILKLICTNSASQERKEAEDLLNTVDTISNTLLDWEIILCRIKEECYQQLEISLKVTKTVREFKEWRKKNRINKWKEIELYGQFMWQVNNIRWKVCWHWLMDRNLKQETKLVTRAAQELVLRINLIKVKIAKTEQHSNCRICRKETKVSITNWVSAVY